MAEFQEVMKQAKRMCEASGDTCLGCPVDGGGTCVFMKSLWGLTEEKIAETEKIVMEWAAEHPEPRYPTWNEWYKATFPNSNFHTVPCPSMFYKICETSNYHGEVECYECRNQPIPADIAKKLGIKPIGGNEDA